MPSTQHDACFAALLFDGVCTYDECWLDATRFPAGPAKHRQRTRWRRPVPNIANGLRLIKEDHEDRCDRRRLRNCDTRRAMPIFRPRQLTLLDKYYGEDVKTLYSTTVTVTGGDLSNGRASGIVRSDDGNLAVELCLPVALGGSSGGTNPEQLFAAAY